MLSAMLLASCSSESSKVDTSEAEPTKTSEPVDVASAQKEDGGNQAGSGVNGIVSDTPAGKRYAEILAEAKELEKQATDQASMMRVIAQIEQLFKDFLVEFPEGQESNDASFQLGMLYISINRQAEGVPHLERFIDETQGIAADKIGYAHFYLAEAYKSTDQFEKAEGHYRIVLDSYSSLNPQLTAMAQSNMQDIETLKRLKIGGEPIPFEFTDLNGKTVSLDKLKGKVVLIDFWATWCKPCIAEMPNVIKLHKEYKDAGFEIVGVSLDRDKAAFESYISRNGMDWPQQFDGKGWGNEIAAKYKVRSIPATYLLDREGKIRYRSIRGPQLEKAVAQLVKEKA
jgi:thiol-disulfide isomerase/thioredoxin